MWCNCMNGLSIISSALALDTSNGLASISPALHSSMPLSLHSTHLYPHVSLVVDASVGPGTLTARHRGRGLCLGHVQDTILFCVGSACCYVVCAMDAAGVH